MEIYLVLNTKDPEEPFVIDICSSIEAAENLREKYIENFGTKDAEYFINIDTVDITNTKDVLWSAYE